MLSRELWCARGKNKYLPEEVKEKGYAKYCKNYDKKHEAKEIVKEPVKKEVVKKEEKPVRRLPKKPEVNKEPVYEDKEVKSDEKTTIKGKEPTDKQNKQLSKFSIDNKKISDLVKSGKTLTEARNEVWGKK